MFHNFELVVGFPMIDPHYPHIVITFAYRGCKIEIERDEDKVYQQEIYSAWVNYEKGCTVAVPIAMTRKDAIKRAKKWIDRKFD